MAHSGTVTYSTAVPSDTASDSLTIVPRYLPLILSESTMFDCLTVRTFKWSLARIRDSPLIRRSKAHTFP